jgi:hypothetical protein
MAVPYVFANATSAIPLSNLDNNFSTPVTIGNVAIQLGNTATTLSNLSLANVTITSSSISNVTVGSTANAVVYANTTNALVTNSNLTFNGTTFTVANDASISGLTVGKGAGSIATNTAVGASALAANTTGAFNTAVGNITLNTNLTGLQNVAVGHGSLYTNKADYNVAVGVNALNANSTGANNTAFGTNALLANTTASNNTAVGYQAGYTNQTGTGETYLGYQAGYLNTGNYNTFVGVTAGYAASSGTLNSFFGYGAGSTMLTGSKNTIIGSFNGNQGGLDIRTLSNRVVLSDGDGNPYFQLNQGGGNRQLSFDGGEFFPTTDNVVSCGFSSLRWSVVYAATALINTSDRNLKQDIAELDNSEKRVAIAIKSLIKKYRFKDSVAEKGDNARIHVGAIAQEVASAFEAEGLDPTRYGLFCSDTWYEVDGKKLNPGGEFYKSTDESVVAVTQLGLRYEELLAFVISAL